MSRVGKYPVAIKDGVVVSINDSILLVKGKKGESSIAIPSNIKVEIADSTVTISPLNNNKDTISMWGTLRALVNNMVTGVSDGFKVALEINGVGLRAAIKEKNLVMQLGFSHEVVFPIPDNVSIVCPDPTHINIEGTDKQVVGQVAAKIISYKKTEPYKGKGIKKVGAYVRRKEGKKK